jgi:hypothetical protein
MDWRTSFGTSCLISKEEVCWVRITGRGYNIIFVYGDRISLHLGESFGQ